MAPLKLFLYISLISFLALIVLLVFDPGSGFISYLVPAIFAGLAIGVRGTSTVFKSFSFTLWIFASVSLAMFNPQYFLELGDFKLSSLIVPLIQVIMFGMGTSLSMSDFSRVLKSPKGVSIGLVLQFSIMPLVGIILANTFDFSPEIAAGIVLVGASPGGVASNVMSYIANANLALSVTITAIGTLLSPVITPLLMKLLANQFIEIEFWAMMWNIVKMIIIPIILGVLFNRFLHGKMKWLDKTMPAISMVGIAIVITIITAAGRDSLLSIGVLLIVAAIVHNTLGYVLGYWGGRLFGMDEESCRTIAIEVGMQNSGMASGIAVGMGKIATVGLAPAVFGPWMNVTGSALANFWRRKAIEP